MSNDPFSSPATGDLFKMFDHEGALLLFTVHSVEAGVETEYGTYDVPKCDVVVLDGADAGMTFTDSLVFGRVMRGQLSGRVGGMVLGRAERGTARPGKAAPWQLADPTEDDKVLARAWIAKQADVEEPF